MRFAFETNAMPQLKIEQSPDAIVVVAMLRAMLVEKLLNGFAAEVSAIQAARFQQHLANRFQARPGQPTAPRRGESKFRAVENRVRQQVFHRFFQNPFAGQSLDLDFARNAGRVFNQHVIEKRHAALDGCGHAHVVLLH